MEIKKTPIPQALRLNVDSVPLPKEPHLATVISMFSEKMSADAYKICEAALTPELTYRLFFSLGEIMKLHPKFFEPYSKDMRELLGNLAQAFHHQK